MKTKLLYLGEVLRGSFWFVPALVTAAAAALAFGLVALDRVLAERLDNPWDWTYTGGPDGARAVLSAIAGSMVTVAGVVFSITIVALTLASQQYGPRLLRNFIRDRSNQFVLGTFVATYLYCLLVLRTVRGDEYGQFVPNLAVAVGVLLAVVSLGVLIFFIHHVARSIRASEVIDRVTRELHETIGRLYPERLGEGGAPAPADEPAEPRGAAADVHAAGSGYVVAVDPEKLFRVAGEHGLCVELVQRPGRFVVRGEVVARARPADRATDAVCDSFARAFTLGPERTPLQDVEFCVDQLVEVAVRALSPGTNDPFTAVNALDRLGEALCELVRRDLPSPYRYDGEGRLRVVAHPVAGPDVLDAAFHQVRQYGRSSAAVVIRLLETLERVGRHAVRPGDLAAVLRHADLTREAGVGALPQGADRLAVEDRYRRVLAACARGEGGGRSQPGLSPRQAADGVGVG